MSMSIVRNREIKPPPKGPKCKCGAPFCLAIPRNGITESKLSIRLRLIFEKEVKWNHIDFWNENARKGLEGTAAYILHDAPRELEQWEFVYLKAPGGGTRQETLLDLQKFKE